MFVFNSFPSKFPAVCKLSSVEFRATAGDSAARHAPGLSCASAGNLFPAADVTNVSMGNKNGRISLRTSIIYYIKIQYGNRLYNDDVRGTRENRS